ncbi:RTA1-domain-containing protein [Crassisporium funariophilum]|nr:RTA1-domain-containing protein [Crassisporium funariophilum]
MASFNDTLTHAVVDATRHNFGGSPYHYIPTEGVAITFITLFALSTLVHAGQAIVYRMWWLFPTACLCGLLEVLGWSARLWSSFSPSMAAPFEMQITATILGPTPLLAANFVIFGVIIQRLGAQYSRLSPKWYTILFCTGDVVSLVVQGVGGGMAATAAGNGRDPTLGGHIMLGGICFQLFIITIYAICAAEFYVRYSQDWPMLGRVASSGSGVGKDSEYTHESGQMNGRLTVMCGALIFSTTCLFIRAVYRTIELSNGWNGRIISTQVLFNVLDGAMIVLAVYTLNIAHPGLLLGSRLRLAQANNQGVEKEPRIEVTPSPN